jgi:hypothetical protein
MGGFMYVRAIRAREREAMIMAEEARRAEQQARMAAEALRAARETAGGEDRSQAEQKKD